MSLPPPSISAILVTWNRCDLLKAAIDSLVRQEYPRLEIVVVDNGSTDNTEGMLSGLPFPVRYLYNKGNLGACVARNQGVLASGGEMLLFMDSDAEILTEGALMRLARELAGDPTCAGAAGIIYSDRLAEKVWCWSPCMDAEGFHDPKASVLPREDVKILSTCFALFRSDLFIRLGGFDPFYFYLYEDADLSARILAEGRRLLIDPEIQILHHYDEHGRTERNPVQYHRYHESLRLYYLLKIQGVRDWAASVSKYLFHPDRTRARFPYLSWMNFLESYAVRPLWQLLTLPVMPKRRRYDWLAHTPPATRTDVLGGVSHGA